MKNKQPRKFLPLIFLSSAFFVFSISARAQTIQPEPEIVREMIAYAAKVEKTMAQSRSRVASQQLNSARQIEQKSALSQETVARNSSTYALERKAFDILNRERAARGLPPLKWNEDMARVARLHSENMARYKFFSHTGLDGSKVNDRAQRLVDRTWYSIGENIAFNKGFKLPVESACQQWMNSPGHRENILDPNWTESGVGAAFAPDGSFYMTQVFIY